MQVPSFSPARDGRLHPRGGSVELLCMHELPRILQGSIKGGRAWAAFYEGRMPLKYH